MTLIRNFFLNTLSKPKKFPSQKPPQNKKYFIIGAGPAGSAVHKALREQNVPEKNIYHVEREANRGGKCKTYQNPTNPELKSEYGAHWITPNYANVIKAIKKHQIKTESILPTHKTGIGFVDDFMKKSAIEKIMMIPSIAMHFMRYFYQFTRYQKFIDKGTELPDEFSLPFSEFAKKHKMTYMTEILKPIVPGFGYGPMEITPARLILAYTGKTIPLELVVSFIGIGYPMLSIQGGFQHFIEKYSSSHSVTTSTTTTHIERSPENIKIDYNVNGQAHSVEVDTLIIATSPYEWPGLGMELTPLENECVKQLKVRRYPVAIVSVSNIDPHLYFFSNAMELENFSKNQGEIAMIATRDNRSHPTDGRLCTFFQNTPERDANSPPVDEHQERELFMKKLYELADKHGWKIEKVHDYKVWPDYMPYLPPQLSYALERSQMDPNTNTAYVTSVLPDGFEDVEKTIEMGERCVKLIFGEKFENPSVILSGLSMNFFPGAAKPYNKQNETTPEKNVQFFTSRL